MLEETNDFNRGYNKGMEVALSMLNDALKTELESFGTAIAHVDILRIKYEVLSQRNNYA